MHNWFPSSKKEKKPAARRSLCLLELLPARLQVSLHWEGMLHHAAKAPWLPPTDTYIHLPCYSLRSEDASILRTNGLTIDEELWKSDFSDFGPMRSEPW